ncbi:hypothetical protein BX667DRAFT_505468 [Coemansia mojavensis]|nr:hypothetical protein BX667DRAFT_505468 [Coemansia mojavensis]
MREEVWDACNEAEENQAPGLDGLPVELYLYCDEAREILYQLANHILTDPLLLTLEFTAGTIGSFISPQQTANILGGDIWDNIYKGVNAHLSKAKPQILPINGAVYHLSNHFTLIPDGTPIRFFGTYIGNNIRYSSIAKEYLLKLINQAARLAACNSTLNDRVNAVATLLIPGLAYQMQFIPVEQAQLEKTARILSRLVWGTGKKPHLHCSIMALPQSEGGFGLPDINTLQQTTLTKMAHQLAKDMYYIVWGSENVHVPVCVRYSQDSWPEIWDNVFQATYTENTRAFISLERGIAPALSLPLMATEGVYIKGIEWNILTKALKEMGLLRTVYKGNRGKLNMLCRHITVADTSDICMAAKHVCADTPNLESAQTSLINKLASFYNETKAHNQKLSAAAQQLPLVYNLMLGDTNSVGNAVPFADWQNQSTVCQILFPAVNKPSLPELPHQEHFALLDAPKWSLHIACLPNAQLQKKFYDQLFPAWSRIAQAIEPNILLEIALENRRKVKECSHIPSSIPTSLNIPLIDATSNIPATLAPLLKWVQVWNAKTQTANDFHTLWQLAISSLAYLTWLRRNWLVYSGGRWLLDYIAKVFNMRFKDLMKDHISEESPLYARIHLAQLEVPKG